MENRLLIFDIDGTITDSVALHQECYNEAINQMNLKKGDGFEEYTHHTDRYIFKEIYKKNIGIYPKEQVILEFYTIIKEIYFKKIKTQCFTEIKGAEIFMKKILDKKRIPYVFATGSIKSLALSKLSKFEIEGVEDRLATSDCFDSREAIVEEAIKKASIYYDKKNFSDKIVIGDGKWDYFTAKNLGISFLGIGSNPYLSKLLNEYKNSIWKDFEHQTEINLFSDFIKQPM